MAFVSLISSPKSVSHMARAWLVFISLTSPVAAQHMPLYLDNRFPGLSHVGHLAQHQTAEFRHDGFGQPGESSFTSIECGKDRPVIGGRLSVLSASLLLVTTTSRMNTNRG